MSRFQTMDHVSLATVELSSNTLFQCPLGLIPHFYTEMPEYARLILLKACQCPLGLIPHFYFGNEFKNDADGNCSVSMPSRAYTSFLHLEKNMENGKRVRCQCPLGLIPHFYPSWCASCEGYIRASVNALSGLYLIST